MAAERRVDPEGLLPLTPVALNILLALDDARHERDVGASERMVGAVLGKRG